MYLIQKIRYYLSLTTIFLVPLLFNPFSNDIFNTIKGVALIILTSLMLLFWGLESFVSKKFTIKITWVNSIVLVIFAITALTVIANTPLVAGVLGQSGPTGITSSIFGLYGSLGTGFITIAALCVFYFCLSLTVDTKEKVMTSLRVLSGAGVVAVIVSLIRYIVPNLSFNNGLDIIFKGYNFVNPAFPTAYPPQNFATIGEYYLMPLFLLICIIFNLNHVLSFKSEGKNKKTLYYIDLVMLFILSFGFVTITWNNVFTFVFYGIAVVSILAMLIKNTGPLPLSKSGPKGSFLGVIVIAIGAVASAITLVVAKINQITSPVPPLDASWGTTFSALGSSLKNGFLGIGPENFGAAFNQSKPVGLNGTVLIFENINKAGNYLLEVIASYGLIGLGAFIYIAIRFILFFIKNKSNADSYLFAFMIVFLVTFVSFFFVPLNLTLLFTVFVLLALFSSFISLNTNSTKSLVIAMKGNSVGNRLFTTQNLGDKASDKNISHIMFGSLTIIIFIVGVFFAYNLFLSNYYYSQSIREATDLTKNDNLNTALNTNAKAIQAFSYSDNYYNRYAALVFQRLINYSGDVSKRIQAENKDKPAPTDTTQTQQSQLTAQEQKDIQTLVDVIVANVDKSTQINPLNYENYFLGARVYSELAKNFQGQSLQKAKDYISAAISLNPQNPSLYLLAADIALLDNDANNARNYLITSINKFPSLDAYGRLAQLYRALKQYDAAVDVLRSAQQFAAKDSDVYKQIDQAITQVTDDKKKDPDANKPTTTPTPTATPTKTPTPTVKK